MKKWSQVRQLEELRGVCLVYSEVVFLKCSYTCMSIAFICTECDTMSHYLLYKYMVFRWRIHFTDSLISITVWCRFDKTSDNYLRFIFHHNVLSFLLHRKLVNVFVVLVQGESWHRHMETETWIVGHCLVCFISQSINQSVSQSVNQSKSVSINSRSKTHLCSIYSCFPG